MHIILFGIAFKKGLDGSYAISIYHAKLFHFGENTYFIYSTTKDVSGCSILCNQKYLVDFYQLCIKLNNT